MHQIRNYVQGVNRSEVARLKQRLDAECAAAHLALYGFAPTGKHEYITARLENMGRLHDALADQVGEQEATEMLVRAMDGSFKRSDHLQ